MASESGLKELSRRSPGENRFTSEQLVTSIAVVELWLSLRTWHTPIPMAILIEALK